MHVLGINQAELTRRINASRVKRGEKPVSHAAISMAFGASSHTKLMPDINEILGGEVPSIVSVGRISYDLRSRIIAGLAELDDQQVKLVADVIAGLVRK